MDNHVEHFYNTGKLLTGTYYFDPPLIVPEIEELHSLLRNIQGSKVILNPLSRDTGNYNMGQTLLWLDVSNNTITGWQNVDTVDEEDGEGEYVLNNLRSIQRWCANNDCNMPYRDGRLFLAELPNTEDIFNQLNESDDFDWVDTSTDNLSGQRLYDIIQNYFSTYHNGRYWLEQRDGFIELWGDSGGNLGTYIYFEFTMSQFTIDILIQALKTALLEVEEDEVRYDYIHLAQVLEPIIGPINF